MAQRVPTELGEKPIGILLMNYALPAIMAMVASSLYNGCKGDDLFQLVSGVLRKGDLVNIYMVNGELGETYMLWENIMVYQAFDASGNTIPSEDTVTPAARVNLLLEEGYTEQFYKELNGGSLRLVKVWR